MWLGRCFAVLDIRLVMAGAEARPGRGPGPGQRKSALFLSLLVFLELIQISCSSSDIHSDGLLLTDDPYAFTSNQYNASIPENSVGKVFVVPDVKMGIYCDDPAVSIKYKIVGGDHENFFKAQAERVGNFVFLMIRTRTSNVNVLNRERTEQYQLKVKAVFRGPDRQRLKSKAGTVVNVKVSFSFYSVLLCIKSII